LGFFISSELGINIYYMEIQSIDLYGDFLLNGSTGSSGQVLTFDETGGFTWGTASASGSGPTSSYAKTEGYSYVICETVNTGNTVSDAITNGTNLLNAYTQAKNLNVGGLSSTNRVSVLLMPGDYDLGDTGQFQLDTSYVDIVGVSTNPYNTILRSSGQYATLQYVSPIDSSLRNVYLKTGTTLAVDDNGGAGDGSYLRWDNVVLEGNSFNDGAYLSGFQNIYGEFRNIDILDLTNAFVTATGSINGVFENIKIGDGGASIAVIPYPENPNLTLSGTFSDIVIGSGGIALTSWGNMSGTFRNIVSESPCLSANFDTEGNFENIETSNGIFTGSNLLYIGHIKGTFRNLKVTGPGGFQTFEYIDGIFENLEISGGGSDVFSANGTISGTFSNITIGDVDFAFRDPDTLCGTFENIKIGNVMSSAFKTSVDVVGTNPGKLYGTFKNITIGNVDDSAFSSQDLISGDFENIKIGNFTDTTNNYCFYTEWSNSIIDGNFKNIQIGNSDGTSQAYIFTSGATLSGTYSDINIGQSNYWNTATTLVFFAGLQGVGTSSLMGSFENLDIKSNGVIFYSQAGNLDCTMNNLKTSNFTNLICSNYDILGTYSNIKCFGTGSYLFDSTYGSINVNLENLHSDYVVNYFVRGVNVEGEYKNLSIGYGDYIFTTNGGYLDTVIDNLEIKSFGLYLFKGSSSYKMTGTFSNFIIGDGPYMFQGSSLTYSGHYKNLLIGSVSGGIFDGKFDGVIDNLNTISSFGYGHEIHGKVINSRIINLDPLAFGGQGRIIAYLPAVFENNTILNDPAQTFTIEYLGSPGFPVVPDVQASYNIVNCLIGGVDVNVIGGNNAESLGFTNPLGV